MLSVPLKVTDKTDLTKPLLAFIAQSFFPDVVEQHASSVEYLHGLREDVRNTTDKNEHTLELYQR